MICIIAGLLNIFYKKRLGGRVKKPLSILFLAVWAFLFSLPCFAGGDTKVEVPPKASHALKQYMSKFGSLVAGLEILKLKEKNPDWKTIDKTVADMNQTLSDMQKADTNNAYKEYTDLLATSLADIRQLAEKKDRNIYNSFDKLSNTCFQCHAAHRPADFLKPKKNQQLSGQND